VTDPHPNDPPTLDYAPPPRRLKFAKRATGGLAKFIGTLVGIAFMGFAAIVYGIDLSTQKSRYVGAAVLFGLGISAGWHESKQDNHLSRTDSSSLGSASDGSLRR
jgi:hypothetical protein